MFNKTEVAMILGGAALVASILIIAIGPKPPPAQATAIKEDRAASRRDVGPRVVRIESVPMSVPLPPAPPVPRTVSTPLAIEPDAEAVVERKSWKPEAQSKKERDVCAKHGMRKVKTGKRWRCKK